MLWLEILCNMFKNLFLLVTVVFALFQFSNEEPLILNTATYCSFNLKNKDVTMPGKTWVATISDKTILFNFCRFLKEVKSCENLVACLINQNRNISLGHEFFIEDAYGPYELSLRTSSSQCLSDSSKNYTLVVNFGCNSDMPEAPVVKKMGCTYVVEMMDPQCTPMCTSRIMGSLLDLRPLKGSYSFTSEIGQFIISLCEQNNQCESSEINACLLHNNRSINISSLSTTSVKYDEKEHQIVILGNTFKANSIKKDKRLKLLIKCNWKGDNKIHYRQVRPQGKIYHFEMESPFGCVKNQDPSHCLISSEMYSYNLTGLNLHSRWNVENINNNEKMFINICGPLILPSESNACTETNAQVCHITENGEYINKGFALTSLSVNGDTVTAAIENGFTCQHDSTQNYRTVVTFECAENEEGPQFQSEEKCQTNIKWKSPNACPAYDKQSCYSPKSHYLKCVFEHEGKNYDLSPLRLYNGSYVVESRNASIEYLLNICGPIYDEALFCATDVTVARRVKGWVNPKYRLPVMGKTDGTELYYFKDQRLIFHMSKGVYCDGNDSSSEIEFECSCKEEILTTEENACFVKFLWKTKYVCSNPASRCSTNNIIKSIEDVSFTSKFGNKSKIFEFNICNTTYQECSVHYKNTTLNCNKPLSTNNLLDIQICGSVDSVNKTSVNLLCRKINNKGFILFVVNTDINISTNYFIHQICSGKLTETSKFGELSKYHIQKAEAETQASTVVTAFTENCTITRQSISYEYSLKELWNNSTIALTNVPVFSSCPNVTFNNSDMYVQLTYLTNNSCTQSKKFGRFYYETYLYCAPAEAPFSSENGLCFSRFIHKSRDFCDFFETNASMSSTSIALLSIGIILLILGMLVVAILLLRYNGKRSVFSNGPLAYSSIYIKDGDM